MKPANPAAITLQPPPEGGHSYLLLGQILIARYYEDLLRFCNHAVRDTDSARDVVQETYQRFLTAQQADTSILDPKAFLRQIARRLLVDRHRRARVRGHLDIDDLAEADEPAAPQHLQPEEVFASMEVIRAYVGTIEALSPRCREAFILHVFDEIPHAQIAKEMGISYSMVEKHIVRGMVACKLCERRLAGSAGGNCRNPA